MLETNAPLLDACDFESKPAATRHGQSAELGPDVVQKLNQADVVLAVITNQPVPGALSEMNWALARGKLLIPIVSSAVPAHYYDAFPPYFVVDPMDPSKVERQIVQFLAEKRQAGNGKAALLALSTLAVALLLFRADAK